MPSSLCLHLCNMHLPHPYCLFPCPNISLTYVHVELIFLGETPKNYSPQIQHYNRSKIAISPKPSLFIYLQEHGKFAGSYTHIEKFLLYINHYCLHILREWQGLIYLANLLDLLWTASWALWAPSSPPLGNARRSNLMLPCVSNHSRSGFKGAMSLLCFKGGIPQQPCTSPFKWPECFLILNHGIGSHEPFDDVHL